MKKTFSVVHSADWHIGPFTGPEENGINLREKDTEKCLEKLVETVEEQNPELVLVPGDLFHAGKIWGDRQSREVITARRAISRMKNAADCVVVMRGTPNHDGSGQFDLLREFFDDVPNVHIVDFPQVVHTEYVDIAVIPGFDRGTFRAKNAGLGKEEENETLSKELSNIVLGLKTECRENMPSILMAHYTVPGCEDSGSHSRLLSKMEPVLYNETLEAAAFDMVALGHIHKPQRMDGNIFYSGSLNALTFNDEGDEKGFWIHHFDGSEKAWLTDSEFVETPYREFLTMHLGNDEIEAINSGRLDEVAMQRWRMDGCVQGCIVRVFYECSEDLNKAFNHGLLQEALREDGAFTVEVLPERISLSADRTEMDKNTDPEENLRMYLENNGRDADEVQRLTELGRPIISQAIVSRSAGGSLGIFEPLEIAVKNYRTYEEETFDFRDITFCTINGPNGVGKSSLFMDAIVDAIYEQPREGALAIRMKEVPWLRKDEKARSGSISFTFRIGEKTYRIVRTRTKSKKITLNLSELVDEEWEDRSHEKVTDTQLAIEHLIGMDCGTFESCALIMQDKYGLFLEAKNDERMDTLSNLLGLEIYADMESIASDKAKDLKRSVDAMKKEIEVQNANIKETGNPAEDLESAKEQLKDVGEKKAEVISKLQLIQANLAGAEKANERAAEISGEIATASSKVNSLTASVTELEQRISAIDQKLESESTIVQEAEEYRKLEAREKELLGQTAVYTARSQEKATIEEDIMSAEQAAEKTKADIATALQEVEMLEQQSDLEEIQAKAAEYSEKKEKLDGLYEKRRSLDALKGKISDAQHAKELKEREFEQKEQLLWKESEDLKKKTELLGNSGCIDVTKASCRFLSDAVAARDALKIFPEKSAALEKEMKEALEACQDTIDIIQRDIDKLGFDQAEFEKTMAVCDELRPYIAKLEKLQEQQKRIAVLKASISQNEEMLHTYEEKLTTLNSRLQEVDAVLNSHSAAFEECKGIKDRLPHLAQSLEKEKELPVLKEKRQNCVDRTAEASKDIEALREEITKKTESLEAERSLTINLEEHRRSAEEVNRQKESYEQDESRIQTRIGGLRQKLADRKRMADKIKEIQDSLNEMAKDLTDYEALKMAFSSEGIPHQIIKKIVPRMEEVASSILGQMTGGKMGLRFVTEQIKKSDKNKEEVTLDVVIEEFGKSSLPYLSKSGGEKVKASLAVNLALAEIKSSAAGIRLGMLFIDEPPFLDNDGIQAYCDALEMIRDRYNAVKVMAITHDISMKSRFPQNIEVIKTDQGAKVVLA